MPYIIVEHRYEKPLTDDELDVSGDRLSPCLEARGAEWVATYVAEDRLRSICVFTAADAESVRVAHRFADVKFERVWPAFAPFDDPVP